MKPIIKALLRESLLEQNDSDIKELADFVNFAKEFLDITDGLKVYLAFERIPELKTTAYYNLGGYLVVYANDRAKVDVYRSVAHEMVHHKQKLDGRLTNREDGDDGSPIENEANAIAGIIIRKYGKLHPEIYI